MRQRNPYLIPLIMAVILHLILLWVIIHQWSDEAPRQYGLNSNVQVISAVAISESKVSTQAPQKVAKPVEKPTPKPIPPKPEPKPEPKAKPEPKPAPKAEVKPKPVPEKKAEAAKPLKTEVAKAAPKVTPKPTAAELKTKALKEKQEKLKQQKLNAEKAQQLQQKLMQQQLAAEQKKLKEQQQKAASQAKALQQKLWQEQLASERSQLQKAAQESHQALQLQGALDEYKSQIIAAISQYWIVPPETTPNMYCRLLIKLAPTGAVLKVEMLHSSGDPVLDRSAREAVMKASPLPIPKEARLFDSFRELRLSFRPEGVVQG